MNKINGLEEEINFLRKKKNAIILAHNYQVPEVQDIADYTGDSLGLSQQAAKTDAEIIVFCGVHFMAETASIISPNKKVLIPDTEAGCSLSDTINLEQLKKWKKENPGAVVVSYVNTSAEVKSETDYCVTSSNAVQVVNAIPEDKEILFLPDVYLGSYVNKVTGRKMQLWPGECHVHAGIRPIDVQAMREKRPNAEMIVHPECGCTTPFLYNSVKSNNTTNNVKFLSTGGMKKYSVESESDEFIVATETGMLYALQKENPDKKFYAANENAVCEFMKMITLEKVLHSLREEVFEVKVPEDIAVKAKKSIDRMLEISA
ncbi:MAG: quinolinate synthase NadA [Candidatus Dadabacteria bacterium]|nr:quinolinate synthase NadA [Candidatus Dadabacteria bacterium]NIQ15222.1 quinolinate synthase NadA [Candidatus Dadabacteria bacterium]